MILRLVTGLVPVLAFLGLLVFLDSYKLIPLRRVLVAAGAGVLAALASLACNMAILSAAGLDLPAYARWIAPWVEEAWKALPIAWWVRRGRVGFLVDAAILGFAVGAGFAVFENGYYVFQLGAGEGSSIALWVVRGFGTAIMHGSATAIFALFARGMADRRSDSGPWVLLPGLLGAVLIHSLFNRFFLPPLAATFVQLTVAPLLVALVFARSERATKQWLGTGFDTDAELLDLILSGEIAETRVGKYLEALKANFPPLAVADMLMLLRVHLELSLRAKGILMAREAGLDLQPDESVRANLEELKYLEKAIGPTGRLAVQPILGRNSRDLWQIHALAERAG